MTSVLPHDVDAVSLLSGVLRLSANGIQCSMRCNLAAWDHALRREQRCPPSAVARTLLCMIMPCHMRFQVAGSVPRQAVQEQGPGDEGPHQTLRPRGGRSAEVRVRLAFLAHDRRATSYRPGMLAEHGLPLRCHVSPVGKD